MSTEKTLPASSRLSLPAALHDLHVGIVLFDPETGAMLDANEQLVELSGYSVETLRTRTIEEVSANTYTYTQTAAERRITAAADGEPQSFEWRLKRADGELRWVSITLSSFTVSGRSVVLGEITDITEYKHADRRVSLFYRLLRHNLRNDLNVISGFATRIEQLATGEAADTVDQREAIETAARKVDSAASGLARISESVKQIESTINREQCDWGRRPAATVIDEVVADIESVDDSQVTVEERTEMWIAVDSAFDHALSHAVENAITHAECPEPTVRLVVDESPNTGRVEISIEDEGPPIPRMEIDALDEHTETTPTSHGSGVGLFVMKWCIESLGGELAIDREGGGNTVYFYLPPKEPPADSPRSTTNADR